MTALRAEHFDLDDDDRRAVAALDPEHVELRAIVGELPPAADRAVRRLLEELARGASVHLVPVNAELTTQQTADMLGLSRTYLVRLIGQGVIPAHMAGTHRRLKASDVLAYRDERERRYAGLEELARAEEALGLTY